MYPNKISTYNYQLIFVSFGLIISNVLFLFPFAEVAGYKLSLFHLFAPIYIVFSIIFFTQSKKIIMGRSLLIYLSAYSIVLFLIVSIEIVTGRLNYSEILKQSLVVGFIFCLAPFLDQWIMNIRYLLSLLRLYSGLLGTTTGGSCSRTCSSSWRRYSSPTTGRLVFQLALGLMVPYCY